LRIGPPSWAGAALRWEKLVSFVAQLPPAGNEPADAAVLVPVYERDGQPVVVLIRRSTSLASDPGHIAFPGGRIEAGESAADAALREANEEVGLDATTIAALASLGTFGRRNRHVAAFVALLTGQPRLTADRVEVDALFEVPLVELVAEDACWEESWNGRSMFFFARRSPAGDTGDLVWGLTAGILWDLVTRLAAAVVPRGRAGQQLA
jgi:8-oxo-dGTP pyrophosphatase MutT (NUDIX family)